MGAPARGDVRLAARHCLFVEGEGPDSLDVILLGALLRSNGLEHVGVAPMGPSDNVGAAARALHKHHAEYYFLADRDTQAPDVVERSWERFPDPKASNLLIWPKRELENYLIEPAYLAKCGRLKPKADVARDLLCAARGRVYLDAANLTIMEIRDAWRGKWVPNLHASADAASREAGLAKAVEALSALEPHASAMLELVSADAVAKRYNTIADDLTGGADPLELGRGSWLDRMSGKELWHSVVNKCVRVTGRDGGVVQDDERARAVAQRLARLPLDEQPADFRQLVEMLHRVAPRTPVA